MFKQGCQLFRIAWREEPKYERKKYLNILQVFLHLHPVSVLTLRKNDKQKKKKKGYVRVDSPGLKLLLHLKARRCQKFEYLMPE